VLEDFLKHALIHPAFLRSQNVVVPGAADRDRFFRFAPPGHFYSPLPDLGEVRLESGRLFDASGSTLPGIDLRVPRQIDHARALGRWQGEMPFPDRPTPGARFHLDNAFFSYGDAITLYGTMCELRPRRIIEVGSGFSSAAILDVNERFFDGRIELTFVEPNAERLEALLAAGDEARARVLRQPVQSVPPAVFDELDAGDVLFIDSSHVGKIGSDVLHLLFAVLPRLKRGVLVHFHDVLWPFEYPLAWLEDGRAWNEAYLVRAFLQYNAAFEIVYFNSFMALHHREEVERSMPRALEAPSSAVTPGNSSLWIRRS
jgi:hypothetical protein